eukprot:280228_1
MISRDSNARDIQISRRARYADDNASDTTSEEKITDPDIGNLTVNLEAETSHPRIVRALSSKYLQQTPTQQQEIAQDMLSQMKQLKAHNEVMGYHGFSGLLERHDSNMNLTLTEDDDASHYIQRIRKHRMRNGKHIVLPETQPLRQKLEDISGSINRIRQDLQNQCSDHDGDSTISTAELNETIMFFHTQLTAIQDRIEDAEIDIETVIDVAFVKYQEEIAMKTQKIKTLRKEKKEREKQMQVDKEKELQKIIDAQRTQIDQLIRGRNNTQRTRSLSQSGTTAATMLHAQYSNDNTRRRSISTHSEDEDTDASLDELLDGARASQHIQNGTMIMPSIDKFVPGTAAAVSLYSPVTPLRDEGYYKYHNRLQVQLQQQHEQVQPPPLLSDNAIKIIGGVALGLSIIWILSKYID